MQYESLNIALETIKHELGAPDCLINGAGGNHPKGSTESESFCIDDSHLKSFLQQ